MPDTIQEGFGTSTPVILSGATNDILVRYIQAPPDGFVRIRAMAVPFLQTAGAAVGAAPVALVVLRCAAGVGISGANGQLGIPLRPGGTVLPGFPDVAQLNASIEFLWGCYQRIGNPRDWFFLDDDQNHVDLVARDTQKLAVYVSSLVDSTVIPPVISAASSIGVTLSVLGSQGKLSERTGIPGIGDSRSLPRYDASIPSHVGNQTK